MSEEHQHKFVYSGLRWACGALNRPGSGSVNVYYGHAYHCEECLEPRVEPINGGDYNSYQERLPGSSPATDREWQLLVPKCDQNARVWR